MTADGFRRIALSLPEAIESAHMNHPDFRVGGRIFATLGSPDAAHGMVKLSPEQQALFLRVDPAAFAPASGAWGLNGSTLVRLASAKTGVVRDAMRMAWRNVAPRRLASKIDLPADAEKRA
jgi:hypothetical protein